MSKSELSPEQVEKIHIEYMDRIHYRRMRETRVLWAKMAVPSPMMDIFLDFRFFAAEADSANTLAEEFKENYELGVSCDSMTNYCFISGTTLPVKMELDLATIEKWIDFMVEKGFSRGCM
jgi:hypothetical protein